VLRDGLKRTPNEGELYYSLGLLLAEDKRLAEAADALATALAAHAPARPRAVQSGPRADRLSRDREAEASLLQALQLDPQDGDIVYALTAFYVQRRQWKRALPFAEQLVTISPADPRARELLEGIKRQLASSG